ncbi:MAG: hypothetical protein KIT84_04165 [Labilithrix sp.]|nr:hypothetical protein [Labilithrix sp.]MCW5810181.1 hypothetical protein [Labilithrix sp.]
MKMRFLAALALAAATTAVACGAPADDDDADADATAEAQTTTARPATADPDATARPADPGATARPASADPNATARPADPGATAATRTVLANLHSFDFASGDPFDRRVMIGQQEPDVSNRASYATPVVPDVERLTGRTPALVSYELSNADRGARTMFDAAAFRAGRDTLRDLVRAQARRGALVSFVWHMRCPKAAVTDRDLFAPNECPRDYRLEELLARKPNGREGAHFREWRAILDELAELLWSLKDDDGEPIPVQLRPFHEFTGNWFWWGRANGASAYAAAWREMVSYLRDGRGLHHLLWVFAPDSPSSNGGWESYYPGDDFVDVIAFDRYDHNDGRFARGYDGDLRAVGSFAKRHGKVAAVSEVGFNLGAHGTNANPTWFTQTMLAPLRKHGFAYAALWRNAPWEKFIPEPGDGAIANDFARMASDDATLFAGTHDLYLPLHVPPES